MRDKKKPHKYFIHTRNKTEQNCRKYATIVDLWGCKHITDILLQVKS